MQRYPQQTTYATGTIHRARKIKAPNIATDQCVVCPIQLHNVSTE